MSATKKAIYSAEAKIQQRRAVVGNLDEKIKHCETKAAFENTNRPTCETFCKDTAAERELVNERLEDLKQTLGDLKDIKDQSCYSSYPQEIHHRLKKKWATCDCPPNDTFGGLEVPKNIEHSFKTQQISELLSDPEKVQQTKFESDVEKKKQTRTDLVEKLKVETQVKIPHGDAIYYELSSALRANTFPGYAWDQTFGLEKSTYTNDVFKKAAANAPRPGSQEASQLEKFRYKADEFTRWRESFFIREQQAKKWTTVQQDKKTGGK